MEWHLPYLIIDVRRNTGVNSILSEEILAYLKRSSVDTGNGPQEYTLDDGTTFRIQTCKPPQISPKGFPMEGIGIPPDYYIAPNIEDYLNNADSVLKFAIELIRNTKI